jgi:hypothetical protein
MKMRNSLIVLTLVALLAVTVCVNFRGTRSQAANVDRTMVLTVKVIDSKGDPVRLAHVNVYHGILSSLIVTPSDYQKDTGVNGIAQFLSIQVNNGADNLSVEVSHEDMATVTKVVHIDRASPMRLPLETVTLQPRSTGGDGELPAANIKVNVKDDQGNILAGALVSIAPTGLGGIANARGGARRHEQTTGADGSVTLPVELVSADSLESIDIAVSKAGYKGSKDVIEIDNKWHKAVGKSSRCGSSQYPGCGCPRHPG